MTNTSFSKRQLCGINTENKSDRLIPAQQLEAACWNGLLNDMLPELIPVSSSKLFLWEVKSKKYYLNIFMSSTPVNIERESSVDPYIFLLMVKQN